MAKAEHVVFKDIEYKSHADLCRVYGVDYALYLGRKKKGWSIQERLYGRNTIPFRGKMYKSESSICTEYGVNYSKYTQRKLLGWSMEERIGGREKKNNKKIHISFKEAITDEGITFDDVLYTTESDLCRHYKVNNRSYRTRKSDGESLEFCLYGRRGKENKVDYINEYVHKENTGTEVEFEGKTYKSDESLCEAYGVSYATFLGRKYSGWTLKEQIYGKKEVVFKGKTYKSEAALCRAYGVDYKLYSNRKIRGYSIEERIYGRKRR